MRRRMMMPTPAQDWDVVWDYTMGLPEDNGFEKTIELSPRIEMTESGLRIQPTNGYVRYVPNGYETCNEGILEETVIYESFTSTNGNRMMLSDGAKGLHIYAISGKIEFNAENTTIAVKSIDTQKEYVIKIERLNGINRIYLDGDKIYETKVVSEKYTAGNRVFFQTAGSYFLKSIKFRKIS